MADRFWVGGIGSQSWANTANWSATNGGAGGASVPTTGDMAYLLQGRSIIDQGLAQGAVSLGGLYISFKGSIGSSAASLTIGVGSGGECRISGDGAYYLAVTCPANGLLQVFNVSGFVRFTGGTIASEVIIGQTGSVTFESGVTWAGTHNNINCCGANVVIEDSVSVNEPNLLVDSGSVVCATDIYTGRISGGSLTVTGIAAVGTGGGGFTIDSGGTYVHNSSGTIGALTVRTGGVATASGATSPFTVDGAIQFVGGTLFNQPPVTITYTTAVVKYGFA